MLNKELVIPQALYAEVIAHCRSRYPKEACGLLAAERADGPIVQMYPMRNVEDSPIGYSLDPKEQLHVEKQMRQAGQRMAGIFHSHTASAAYPSSVDVGLALSPDLSYVVVSLSDQAHPAFKSYRIDGTQVTEEAVILSGRSSATVDVRDMVCAQALAVLGKALAGRPAGGTATVFYNAEDVRRDVLAWASDRGYAAEDTPGRLQLTKR